MKIAIPGILLLAVYLAGCQNQVAITTQENKRELIETFDWPNRIPSAVHGQEVYEKQCASCHGTDGRGTQTAQRAGDEIQEASLSTSVKPLGNVPNFTDPAWERPKTPQELYLALSDLNRMPAAHRAIDQTKLTRQDKWNAIFYIWSLSTRDAGSPADKPTYNTLKKSGVLFIKNCSVCHGTKGLGDGNLAHGLDPKPRNFNDFHWMSDKNSERLFRSISNGRDWTAMPPWKETLTEDERWHIIQYLWTFVYQHPDKEVANHSIAAE